MAADIRLIPVDPPDEPSPQWGWHRVEGLDLDLEVDILATDDDPPVISHVRIAGSAVHAEHLRSIPLGAIERQLRYGVRGGTAVYRHDDDDGPAYLFGSGPQPLTRRADAESAEEFARRVANSYRYYAKLSGKPAMAMAEDSSLPVGTIRRWIREARQLGVLEKGTRGRAG